MVIDAVRALAGPLAVRSSAVDEDGADASFAGQHLTLLNVPSTRRPERGHQADLVVGQLRLGHHLPQARRPVQPPERRGSRAVAARSRDGRGDVHPEPGQRRRRADDRGELGARRGGGLGPGDPGHVPPRSVGRGPRANGRSEEDRHPRGRRRRNRRRGGGHPTSSSRCASTTTSSPQLNALADQCEEVYGRASDIEWAYRRRDPLPPPVPCRHPGRVDDGRPPRSLRARPTCSSRCRSSPG